MLTQGILGLHLLAVGALAITDTTFTWQTLGMLALGMSAWRASKARPKERLKGSREGKLIRQIGSQWLEQQVVPPLLVLPWLLLLRLRTHPSGPYRVLLLLPDSLDATDFRRLRLWLLWKAREAGHQA